MKNRLPHNIKVRQELDASVYELPRRTLGQERWAGLILVVFGGIFAGVGGAWTIPTLLNIFQGSGWVRWIMLIIPLFGLPFLLIGGGICLLGLMIILNCSHGEIRVTRERAFVHGAIRSLALDLET